MKMNIDNRIIETKVFHNHLDQEKYLELCSAALTINLNETFGEYYCVVSSTDSLSKERKVNLSFSTENDPQTLNLILLEKAGIWIVEIDQQIYFISILDGSIVNILKIQTSLIGIYVFDESVLILEEAGFSRVDFKGEVLDEKFFDLIEDFTLIDNVLSITTVEGDESSFEI